MFCTQRCWLMNHDASWMVEKLDASSVKILHDAKTVPDSATTQRVDLLI